MSSLFCKLFNGLLMVFDAGVSGVLTVVKGLGEIAGGVIGAVGSAVSDGLSSLGLGSFPLVLGLGVGAYLLIKGRGEKDNKREPAERTVNVIASPPTVKENEL